MPQQLFHHTIKGSLSKGFKVKKLKTKVEKSTREIIADRLLIEVTDKDKVAVTFSEEDLDRLIRILNSHARGRISSVLRNWVTNLSNGLEQLRKQAFRSP